MGCGVDRRRVLEAVADAQNRTHPYAFRIGSAALWKVPFLLFKDGDVSTAYRELHLDVRVA
jgi:hypothetical protein